MALDPGPAGDAKPVTPSDTTIVAARALYIGVSGDVTVDTASHTDVLFKAVAVGVLPVAALRVKAATAATNIVALY